MNGLKRLFDIAGACAGVVVFAPVMAIVAAAVLVDDGRPVLFRQERLGYRRRPFVIWKFRTMRDGRVTRAGRVLRASGLDEIAQFFNILSGDMSAVGPRPLTVADVQRLGWGSAAFDFRWEVRPGLTGLAQIAGANSSGRVARARSRLCHPLAAPARLPAHRACHLPSMFSGKRAYATPCATGWARFLTSDFQLTSDFCLLTSAFIIGACSLDSKAGWIRGTVSKGCLRTNCRTT